MGGQRLICADGERVDGGSALGHGVCGGAADYGDGEDGTGEGGGRGGKCFFLSSSSFSFFSSGGGGGFFIYFLGLGSSSDEFHFMLYVARVWILFLGRVDSVAGFSWTGI